MRNSGQYNIDWFYKYYISKGGKTITMQEFHMVFQMTPLDQVLEKMDKDFELTSLYYRDNKLINVWQ